MAEPVRFDVWLRQEMGSRHLSISELALQLAVRPPTVHAWQKPGRRPDVVNCRQLANCFDLPMDEVLAAAYPSNPNP